MISKAEEAESGTTANTGQVYGGSREDRIARNKERWEQFRICGKRGHQASNMILTSNPPKHVCKHCGTWFWDVTKRLEGNTPINPDNYEQEIESDLNLTGHGSDGEGQF